MPQLQTGDGCFLFVSCVLRAREQATQLHFTCCYSRLFDVYYCLALRMQTDAVACRPTNAVVRH